MSIGIVGLGKMGAGIARRLAAAGQSVAAFDSDESAIARARDEDIVVAGDLEDLIGRLEVPRHIWVMVPAGEPTDAVFTQLAGLLEADDIAIDGGNTFYKDSSRRAEELAQKGIRFLDVGTSGGIHGERDGYCLMVGGEPATVNALSEVFTLLAASGRSGWFHVGPAGAGHFVKMVHNGIEYGMMQAMAEGFAILRRKQEFDIDLAGVAEVWRHGSVVRSWLLDLVAGTLVDDDSLSGVAPYVPDSGEGRWTVQEAIDLDVSAPVITLSLLERIRSRDEESYADRMLSAMRAAFGGHAVTGSDDTPGTRPA
ncbi:MAG: decarboxylating 6-phosphogluconate dehydrogenase [Rhodothermia bacterium]|nr:decarboxylating 6-phosphogluconate dehydrogenase [Rhodothermia bacterium]